MKHKTRPTIARLAELAGVSKTTVSLALSNAGSISAETREKVRGFAVELGYRPPRQRRLKPKTPGAIGVLLDREFHWAGEQFFTRIIRSLQEEAEREGLHTLFTTISRESMEAGRLPEILADDMVQSIVVVGITQPAFIHSLKRFGKPVVLVSCGSQTDSDFDCVLNDDFQGMQQAVRHLLDLGHRRIGLVGGRLDHLSNLERFRAFRICMDEMADGYDPALAHVSSSDASIPEGRIACNALLNSGEDFTALMCMTDDMAYGALECLQQRGLKVPGDVAVIGFNDLALSAHAVPPLTSVRVCCEELGRAAHQVVRTRLGTAAIAHPLRLMVGSKLIVRDSTGPVQLHAARNAGSADALHPLNRQPVPRP